MNPRKRGSNSSTAFLSRETFQKKKKKIEREREGKRENPDECRLSAFDWRIAATFTPPFSAEIVPCSSKEQSLVVWPCSATCNERRGWCASVWGRTSVQDDISAAADQQTNPRHTTTTTPCTRSFASIAPPPPPPPPFYLRRAILGGGPPREKSVSAAWWQCDRCETWWRVASGSIRVASFPRPLRFSSRSVWSVWGEGGGGERRKEWIVPSPISGSSGWLNIGVGNYL